MLDEQLSQRFLAVAGPAIELAKQKKTKAALLTLEKVDIDQALEPNLYHLVEIQKAALLELLEKEKPAKMLRNFDTVLMLYRAVPMDNKTVYRSAQMQLANLLINLKRVDELEQLYQDFVAQQKLDGEDKLFLSSVLISLNKLDEALKMLDSITHREGATIFATAKTNAALIFKNLKRYQECIRTCTLVSADDDMHMYAKAQLIWAEALYRLGRREDAFEVYKRLRPFHQPFYSEARWQLFIKFPVRAIRENILAFFGKA
ncbi:TPA: tetratricopeptide repeat protein [Pasteurella multocida]|nr:tetratricopeptide repeat protein [Pasteurella multocida]